MLSGKASRHGSGRVRGAVFDGYAALFPRLGDADSAVITTRLVECATALAEQQGQPESTREKAADAMLRLAESHRGGAELQAVLGRAIASALATERASSVQRRLQEARARLET